MSTKDRPTNFNYPLQKKVAALNEPLDVKLAAVDLNLLIALEALLECRNVSRAARHIGSTQPAASRALARLRVLFKDELLIRGSTGMQLTVRGQHLRKALNTALTHIRSVVVTPHVKTATRLCVDQSLGPVFVPRLLLDAANSNQSLLVSTCKSAEDAFEQLYAGAIDLALGGIHETARNIQSLDIASEDFVMLVGGKHHDLQRDPLHTFFSLYHANPVRDGRAMFPQVGKALSAAGLGRSSLVEFPDVMSAALMTLEEKLTLTVPRSVSRWLVQAYPLFPLMPPVTIGRYRICISWADQIAPEETQRTIQQILATARELIAVNSKPARPDDQLNVFRTVYNGEQTHFPCCQSPFSGS